MEKEQPSQTSPPPSLESKELPQQQQLFQRYWNILQQKIQSYDQQDKDHDKISQRREILHRSMKDPRIDRALGAIYGAMIGDALGAYCQFQHKLQEQTVKEAMEMNGGGTFGLQPGQFTDDSEMGASLLYGLTKFDQNISLAKQSTRLVCNIGLEYFNWMLSGPFDIGNTCRGGIDTIHNYLDQIEHFSKNETEEKPQFLDQMFKDIYNHNKMSLANGSLMRISPQGLFFALTGESPLENAQFIKDQIRLTHPAQLLGEAGLFYVQTITDLINRENNSAETFRNIYYGNQNNQVFARLKSWFGEASRDRQDAMPGNHNMGYAKIGFSYALRILNYFAQGKQTRIDQHLYIEWMTWIIGRAGDTDTNAAIAGGILGSIVGFWGLPSKYIIRTLKTITDKRKLDINDIEEQPKILKKSKYGSPKRLYIYEPSYVLMKVLDMVKKCENYKQKYNAQK